MSNAVQALVNGYGFDLEDTYATVAIRGTPGTNDVVPGDIVALCVLDYLRIGTTTAPTSTPGPVNSIFANATKAYGNTANVVQIFGVALDKCAAVLSTAAGSGLNVMPTCRIKLTGRVKAYVNSSASVNTPSGASTWARGSPLVVSNITAAGSIKGVLDACGWADNGTAALSTVALRTHSCKIVGIALSSGSGSTAVLQDVLFDGINGFGSCNNVMG